MLVTQPKVEGASNAKHIYQLIEARSQPREPSGPRRVGRSQPKSRTVLGLACDVLKRRGGELEIAADAFAVAGVVGEPKQGEQLALVSAQLRPVDREGVAEHLR